MRSVLTAFAVLEEVAAHQPVGVSELSRRLALSKTTVQRALMTLHDAGWIEPAEEARTSWHLAIRALVVGSYAIDARPGLRSIAVPVMEEVRRTTEETIHLFLRNGDVMVLIERLDGIKPVKVFNPLGGRAPLHRTSSGKAVLAHLPPAERDRYLAAPLTRGPGRIAVDPDELRRELIDVRRQGFAVNLGQNQPDVSAVGAAILDAVGHPVAAITISGPSERLTEGVCRGLGPKISDAAMRIALGLRINPS